MTPLSIDCFSGRRFIEDSSYVRVYYVGASNVHPLTHAAPLCSASSLCTSVTGSKTMYATACPPPVSSVKLLGTTGFKAPPDAFTSALLTQTYGERLGTPPTNVFPPRTAVFDSNVCRRSSNPSVPPIAFRLIYSSCVRFANTCA